MTALLWLIVTTQNLAWRVNLRLERYANVVRALGADPLAPNTDLSTDIAAVETGVDSLDADVITAASGDATAASLASVEDLLIDLNGFCTSVLDSLEDVLIRVDRLDEALNTLQNATKQL